MIRSKDGSEIFSAWILLVQVASKCTPRGTLIRSDGRPHDPPSLSLKTRAPQKWFEKSLAYLLKHTDWLEVKEVASGCQETVTRLSPDCHSTDEGMEGKEGNGMEGKGTPSAASLAESKIGVEARVAIHYLNEKSGHHYREVADNLLIIQARLNEPEVTIDGVKKMIDRQVLKWKGDPQMEVYLRPETLFRKSKFDGYYGQKDQPATAYGKPPKINLRNALAYKPTHHA